MLNSIPVLTLILYHVFNTFATFLIYCKIFVRTVFFNNSQQKPVCDIISNELLIMLKKQLKLNAEFVMGLFFKGKEVLIDE